MGRFLLVMWEGGGTVPPSMTIARKLIARGHTVRVLGDPTIEAEARAVGCEFAPWTTAPHVTERTVEGALIRDWEYKSPLMMIRRYMATFLAAPAPQWAGDTDAQLEAFAPDVVLCDMFLPATMIPVEARGIPIAGLMANCYVLPTPGIPPMGPGFAPARGLPGRVRDSVLRAVMTRMFSSADGPINEVRASYGLGPVESTFDQMRRGRSFILTTPAFDFTSPAIPASVQYAGPQLDDPVWAEPWVSPWTDDDTRPLVLVGFSSTFQDQVATLNRTVEALAELRVRAVVTLGEMIHTDAVKGRDNVIVVQSAPHNVLLEQAAVLITHCGHGTLMKGLAAGVPLVCMPMGRDQNDAAARVVYRGAGVRIKPAASPEDIRAAVKKVLGDPQYKAAAGRLQGAIADGIGCVDIIAELEAMAGAAASAGHGTVAP
jgi:MGT family glycosyltransferase